MNQNTSIGEKIKALRTSQNLTLKQLGEMTNLSTGFLSQMERGLSSIAIDTLETIAGVLGVSLGSFFSEEPHADCSDPVVHSFSMPTTPVGPQIIQNTLSHDVAAFDFLPRIFTLLPLANTEEEKPGDVQPFRGRIHLYTGRYCDDPVGVDSVYALSGRQYPDSF